MKTKELIAEAVALPVEERTLVIDSILRSLNPAEPHVDRKWAVVAKRRLAELRAGKIKAIPSDEVLSRIRKRFPG